MITLLGLISICFLLFAGESDAMGICAIIGAILAIPGGILGAVCESVLGFSLAGLINSTIGSILETTVGRFFANAFRAFLLPFIVAVIIFMIGA